MGWAASPSKATRPWAICAALPRGALTHDSPFYRTVKTILATGADQQPVVAIDTPKAYRGTRFTRSAADLFAVPPATVH